MNKIKLLLATAALAASSLASAQQQTLLNVSYDVAREFYKDINAAFVPFYKKTTGKDVKIEQSHAGSSAQARAVAEGLDADVVTMNTTTDVDSCRKGRGAKDWARRFPDNARRPRRPCCSSAQRQPQGHQGLGRPAQARRQVVVVNPKTGGNGRYAYLAAWGYCKKKGGTDAQAAEFVGKLYKNVPVLARGGRDATTGLPAAQHGDVLVTFESEVESVNKEFGANKVDVVYPSVSIVAENPVAVVERTVAKKGTADLAKAYLNFLYSKKARRSPPSTTSVPRNQAC
jgi:sulfate transport system substrate-binding protein